jgi:uncharacterized pyridoxal phosphate-containing UPF0001 family protein
LVKQLEELNAELLALQQSTAIKLETLPILHLYQKPELNSDKVPFRGKIEFSMEDLLVANKTHLAASIFTTVKEIAKSPSVEQTQSLIKHYQDLNEKRREPLPLFFQVKALPANNRKGASDEQILEFVDVSSRILSHNLKIERNFSE